MPDWYLWNGYQRRDYYLKGKRITELQHRIVMEMYLKRKLATNEVVHHIDGNRSNNGLINLEVLSSSAHGKLHHPRKFITLTCRTCGKSFTRSATYARQHSTVIKSLACSRSCGIRKIDFFKLKLNSDFYKFCQIETLSELVSRYHVSRATIFNWKRRYRSEHNVAI